MTMTEAGASTGVVRLHDLGMRAPVEIHGTRIGFGTSKTDEKEAWAEIEIYRLHDGGYIAHRAGYSDIYHRLDTRCVTRSGEQRGEPVQARQLPETALPCERCKPPWPESMPPVAQVRWELPRHIFDSCNDPAQVVERLTVIRNNRDHTKSVRYSRPVRDALSMAAGSDPAFAQMSDNAINIELPGSSYMTAPACSAPIPNGCKAAATEVVLALPSEDMVGNGLAQWNPLFRCSDPEHGGLQTAYQVKSADPESVVYFLKLGEEW